MNNFQIYVVDNQQYYCWSTYYERIVTLPIGIKNSFSKDTSSVKVELLHQKYFLN